MRAFRFALPALIAAATVVGCSQSPSTADGSPCGAGPTATATASGSLAATKPPMKEIAATPDANLGKLPPDVGVATGQPAPSALVHDAESKAVELADLYRKGATLVLFYRGGWCPYCNFQIHELTAAYPEYQKRGVTPVAISVDKQDEAAKTEATYTIPFPVLSDPDLVAHRAFRVLHQADDAEVAKLKSFGIDVEKSSGKTHHVFAIPALFLIDKTGTVRWAHADPDYKVRPRTAQILAAIDAAGIAAP